MKGLPYMPQAALLVLSWLAILGNILLLPAAAGIATPAMAVNDPFTFAFGVALWLVAALSIHCALTLKRRIRRRECAGATAPGARRANCHLVIFGNLLTVTAAVAIVACDKTPVQFGFIVGIVALLSTSCAAVLVKIPERRKSTETGPP
jgi:hypothetical protein